MQMKIVAKIRLTAKNTENKLEKVYSCIVANNTNYIEAIRISLVGAR